jgi:serine/threonine protein kinase
VDFNGSLNHPNICQPYDVGPNFLVMELVEAPTLADRIKQGALPLDEALAIARQIADALEVAHEKYIVHRDSGHIHFLSPFNVCAPLTLGISFWVQSKYLVC